MRNEYYSFERGIKREKAFRNSANGGKIVRTLDKSAVLWYDIYKYVNKAETDR